MDWRPRCSRGPRCSPRCRRRHSPHRASCRHGGGWSAPVDAERRRFYRARKGAPLWLSPKAGDAAPQLIALLSSAAIDGLNPQKYFTAQLTESLQKARAKNKRKDIERADEALSEAFVAYVRDLRQDPGVGITWVDPQLKPTPPTPLAALLEASAAPSLSNYVRDMGWMHPFYGELRKAIADHKYSDDDKRQVLELNLKRARILPAGKQRYVLVNAAQQRLFMYEDGKPIGDMVVVVGQTKYPTPMLAAYIRYAALNPYWYVPPDLAWDDVGQFVKKQGFGYFEKMGYEQVSDWSKNAQVLDATKIDWDAVRTGKTEILLRQKPGPRKFHGANQVHVPQPVRGLSPRQSAPEPVQGVGRAISAAAASGSRMRGASANGCSTAS